MAETIVAFAIDKLLQIANTEVDLVGSLPGEIKSISRELQSIKAILKDAEKRAEDNDGIKVWVSQVREVAYQIEDALDDYLFLKHDQGNQPEPDLQGRNNYSCFSLCRVGQCLFQHRTKHDLVITIKMIKEEMGEINRRRAAYQFVTTERVQPEHSTSWQDICSLYVDDTELVGIEGPMTEVTELLRDHPLVALVGMGGLGKSTLARKVYNQVRGHFHIYAWITVSRSYSVVEVLRSMYQQFLEAQEDSNWVQLDDSLRNLMSITEKLRSSLEESKYSYLIVLDDVWEEGPLISCIRAALPANNNGSRLLMTMRDEDVARSSITKLNGIMYKLKPLPIHDAWDLFCNKIFGNGDCPEELRLFANDIIKQCDGLPLTLVAVAGLLSTKKRDYSEWRKFKDTLGSEFAKNRHLKRSTRILLFSYEELPSYLKPCFLYFGLFPKDYLIDCMRLVRLWIAEGFIENCRGPITLEEVALEYLTALVQRNLVQVSGRDVTGRCRNFRVHDVLREIILSKLEESGFSQVMAKDNFLINTHFRRLSVHYCFDKSIQTCSTTCNIRSVLVFDTEDMNSFLTSSQAKMFRFLRVLDLQDASIYAIPEEVGDLHNLQFLSLRNTKVSKLPTSIGHLWNLQTLDLKSSYVFEIPSGAKGLGKLRHLLGYRSETGPYTFSTLAIEIPAEVLVKLVELQKLAFIDGSQSSLIIELRNLKELTRLGITGLLSENGSYLCHAIEKMENLRSLTIISTGSDEVLKVQNINQPPQSLERLYLVGSLEKLPNWITGLNNLARLVLRYSRLENDPAERLQGLPNLIELDLYEAYDGTKLDFGLHGFRKLKVLRLFSLCNLRTIQGALPNLQNFRHRLCQHLEDVPPHIKPYLDLAISNLLRDRC